MKCPKDQTELTTVDYNGVAVDACGTCGGAWLDPVELDAVEDRELDIDTIKGSLVWQQQEAEISCPVCEHTMKAFRYRLWEDLELDLCPRGHGWWLDQGELVRVEASMKDRKDDMLRKYSEEADWNYTVQSIRSKSFIDDVIVGLDQLIEDAFREE